MKTIKNCWHEVFPFECQFGAYLFDGKDAKFYVHHWLTVTQNLVVDFHRKNEEGFVGHCLLVFVDVQTIEINIVTHEVINGELVRHAPIHSTLNGKNTIENTQSFLCEGSLKGFPSAISISVKARDFELQILEKNEPAREE